jgi:parallel beta-helix repeat protein
MKWTRIGGMTALAVALAIGLALSLGLWSHWTASAQDTFIVNDDTTPADGGCGTPDFETEDIEDAIDSGLVADGDTLVICEGTYNPPDAIEVTKALTIEGRAAADRDDIVVQSTGDGLFIPGGGTTVRHLKLEGPGIGGPTIAGGIRIQSDGNTIQDVESTNWDIGIRIFGEGNVVEGSLIHANDNGMEIQGGNGNSVRNNQIEGNAVGVFVVDEDGVLLEGNSLSGNSTHQMLLEGRVNARIQRNNITTSSNGIFLSGTVAESLVVIGGAADKANTFAGPFGGGDYYVNMDCASENTVDATYNWWGGTNRTDIANRIFNDEDNAGTECSAPHDVKGAVVFHPWATGPAPTPTPSPTPSPTATATATGTPTPAATPGATRTIDLSPPGWHDLAWSGANATDPGTVLACISGKYSIAYAWEGPTAGFKRYVEGCAIPGICNMAPLNKYDALLVNITADASCVMPVAP